MSVLFAVIRSTASLAVSVLQFMMFFRAILSWIPDLSDSSISNFLYSLTEWVIMPVRVLFDKMGWNGMMMIDLPFFATFILLSAVSSIL